MTHTLIDEWRPLFEAMTPNVLAVLALLAAVVVLRFILLRAIVFPNSLLLAHPLINETYMKEYIVHTMTIPLAVTDDWQAAEKNSAGHRR
ncbi:MAG: hypothetical protein EXR96_05140 [Nitrospiraceae bacterium]|nr:hypothetical protein [Nitrospiraceae bacterium]